MKPKVSIRKLIPLMLSATGIVLWIIARVAGGGFVDSIDALMFVAALILPVIALVLSKETRPVKVRSRFAIATLIVAAAQVAFAVVYYYIFVAVGGSRAPEIVPGATLLLSIVGMVRGYLINLLYVLAAILFIASSAICYFALRTSKASEDTQSN